VKREINVVYFFRLVIHIYRVLNVKKTYMQLFKGQVCRMWWNIQKRILEVTSPKLKSSL